MTSLPVRRSRRYEVVKFNYTSDNGQNFIQGQFHYKDDNGQPFINLSPSFLETVVTGKKEKIWGDLSNLRKFEVTYAEPRNQLGRAVAVFYIPKLSNALTQIREIRDILKDKFNSFNLQWCTDYIGESRFTEVQPTRINEVNQ